MPRLGRFQGRIHRAALADELVQFERERPPAVGHVNLRAQEEHLTQSRLTQLRIGLGDLRQLAGALGQGRRDAPAQDTAAALRRLILVQPEGGLDPTAEGIGGKGRPVVRGRQGCAEDLAQGRGIGRRAVRDHPAQGLLDDMLRLELHPKELGRKLRHRFPPLPL